MSAQIRAGATRNLALGTISFTICFAAWGLISAFAPAFRAEFHLTAQRRPRFSSPSPCCSARWPACRWACSPTASAAASSSPPCSLSWPRRPPSCPRRRTYRPAPRRTAFLLGLAGSSFAIGVGYRLALVSRRDKQGTALGDLRHGQHRPVGGGVPRAGCRRAASAATAVFYGDGGTVCVVWARGLRPAGAQRAARRAAASGLGAMLHVLASERLAWALSAFYFLTFGGFVAFSIYLPTLLKRPVRADRRRRRLPHRGLRRPGHAAAAGRRHALRPDRRRARAVRRVPRRRPVRAAADVAVDDPVHGRRARLRGAARARQRRGLQAGAAVLPRQTGTVTGLVGAMGGLGGFFPPLLLGFFRDRLGVVWPGFVLLAADRRGALGAQPARVPAAAEGAASRPRLRVLRPHGRAAPRRRLGHHGDRPAGRRDRRRLAQPRRTSTRRS